MSAIETENSFWALVEIMGRQRFAGLVSEQLVAGQHFLRVDVPETKVSKAFSKLFSSGALYCITPLEETVARAMAASIRNKPLDVWDLPDELQSKIRLGSAIIDQHTASATTDDAMLYEEE